MKRNRFLWDTRTDSTRLVTHRHLSFPPGVLKIPKHCYRTALNLLQYQSEKKRRRSWGRSVSRIQLLVKIKSQLRGWLAWVATYAMEAAVTLVIPCMRAFPDRVAFGSFSTELGDVKMCLNVLDLTFECQYTLKVTEALKLTRTSKVPLKSPLVGSSRLYLPSWYMNVGQECVVTWKLWS